MDDDTDAFLAHYGIKGMKWGVRKNNLEGVSARTNRDARKDATEFAKAKMFYGESAGTRRKLIKATVESKSAKDSNYKKAFDHHLGNQDMGKRAAQARGTRKRRDVKNSAAKNARGAVNIARGNSQYAPALLVAGVAVAGAGKRAGVDKIIIRGAKTAFRTATTGSSAQTGSAFLRDLGIG